MSRARVLIPAFLVVIAVLGWAAWKQGAYFATVSYPAAGAVFILLAVLLQRAPFDGRITGPTRVALIALGALTALMFLSIAWSPVPAAALRDGMHACSYIALFGVGLWLTNLLRERMALALVPVVLAGVVVGLATVFVLATGTDVSWYLHGDGTLRFPIGYRNANAAFWMICFWPLLALVTSGKLRWPARVGLAAAGTMLLELMFLSQSRGSIPALAISGLLFILLSRRRLQAAIVIALIALPALPAIPTLLNVYQHAAADAAVVPLLRDSAKVICATVVLSAAISAIAFAAVEPRLKVKERTSKSIAWVLGVLTLLAVLVSVGVFVGRHGGPVGFVDQRIDEFNKVGYPDLHDQGIRYGANVGSNRSDFWRVAINEGLESPLWGGGSGSFQVSYLEHRRSPEAPEDPHSVEALMLSETGLTGLILFGVFIVAAFLAGLRSRRLGPAAGGLAVGALAAATQWLTQASYDWLWNYPGVTGPAIFLLGAAAAPALFDRAVGRGRMTRRLGTIAILIVVLISIPLFLSARYLQRSYGERAEAPLGAVSDLDRAADLNPLDADPLLISASIESELGEHDAAIKHLHEALGRQPDSYLGEYLLAQELSTSDPQAAREALARARELNPHDAGIKALEVKLSSGGSS